MKKISYKSVSDILSPKEMKNITGGSVYVRCICDGEIIIGGWCAYSSCSECMGAEYCAGMSGCEISC